MGLTAKDLVEETAVPESAEEVETNETGRPFVVLESNENGPRVQILDHKIRHYLYAAGCRDIIPYDHVSYPTENLEIIQASAVYPVDYLFRSCEAHELFDEDRMENLKRIPQVREFLSWLSEQEDEIEQRAKDLLEKGLFNFSSINLVFKKDDLVCYTAITGDVQAMRITSIDIERGWHGVAKVIKGNLVIHNGKTLVQGRGAVRIPAFNGDKSISDLPLRTLTPEVEAKLIQRGEKYITMTSTPSYLSSKGKLIRRGYWFDEIFNASGRVMIDLPGLKQADTNYDQWYGVERYSDDETAEVLAITDEVKILCAPVVYGFSFRAKKWGEMRVEDLSAIAFREDAFDRLVLQQRTKDLLFALVDSNTTKERDFIDGKGGGLVFLLHGVPGVGKTFTAESIAEKLHRPLYMVSVGELGVTATDVEKNLQDILETATRWNAILLIDECDIFLEARKEDDMHRNAVVSVFLRMIEYYQGILFLTTNRIRDLDTAFYSRISLPIKYETLNNEGRKAVWLQHLINNGMGAEQAEEFATFLEGLGWNLNGRQIKNAIRIASSLAEREDRPVSYEDFKVVLDYLNKFDNQISNGFKGE